MNAFEQLMSQAQLAPAYRLVILFNLALGAIALAFCLVLVAHHAFTSIQRRQRTTQVRRATSFLARYVASGDRLPGAVAESRRRHGDWATAIVLREARGEMRGEGADRITAALLDMGEVDRLKGLLHSRHDWRRERAVRELAQCGGDQARLAMHAATGDPSAAVRRAAREGLLLDARPASVKAAIASYRADAPTGSACRRSFYARLSAMAPDAARELLASGALDRDEEKVALEALGEARVEAALPLARRHLTDPDPEIRATAARAVGKLADGASVPALTRLLSDPVWFVRAAAAKAFDALRPDAAATEALRAALSDQAWWVRANSAHALAQHGDGGVSTLVSAVEGADTFSRDAGLAALGHAMMAPDARQRLRVALSRLEADAASEPLRRLLEAAPSEPRPVTRAGVRS